MAMKDGVVPASLDGKMVELNIVLHDALSHQHNGLSQVRSGLIIVGMVRGLMDGSGISRECARVWRGSRG